MHLPTLSNTLKDRLRKDLRAYGMIAKVVQLMVGVIFGFTEGILVNMATAAKGNEQERLYFILAVVVVIHLILFGLTLFSTTPLPQFLVEFDETAQKLQKADAQVNVYASFTEIYNAATIATQLCLSAIESRRLAPRNKLDFVLDEVMASWVESRTEVFRFQDGDALYNFAIYEYLDQEKTLKCVWRSQDNRLRIRNRSWEPGNGHVGVCFQRGKTIFSDDASAAGDDNPITTGDPDDKKQYKSMLSTPIHVDGNKKGILVVTSSKPHQFDKELHSRIIEVIAILVGQAIRHCWTKSDKMINPQ